MRTRTARRWTIVFAGALISLGVALPVTAAEERGPEIQYVDVGFDPDDRPYDETSCCQQDPDIRTTTRKLWVDGRERAWLTIKFQAYETFIGYWSVIARLDSRGGPRADYRMTIRDDASRVRCWIASRRSSAVRRGTSAPRPVQREACDLPGAARVRAPGQADQVEVVLTGRGPGEGSEPSTEEYAPDDGGYV
jgi:hypothetical protein